MVTAEEILERLSAAHTLTPDTEERGSAPAERWLVDGGPATVGVIASVTRVVLRRLRPHPADRRRPDPQLPVRPRGVRPADADARGRHRRRSSPTAGGSPPWRKLPGHGIDDPSFLQPTRPMSAIGG